MWWWEKAQDDKSRWWNDILELPTQRQHSHLSIIRPSEAKQTAAQDINIPIPTYVTECILWRSWVLTLWLFSSAQTRPGFWVYKICTFYLLPIYSDTLYHTIEIQQQEQIQWEWFWEGYSFISTVKYIYIYFILNMQGKTFSSRKKKKKTSLAIFFKYEKHLHCWFKCVAFGWKHWVSYNKITANGNAAGREWDNYIYLFFLF